MKISYKTKEQAEAEQLEAERRSTKENRRRAYQQEADPLFLKWQRGEATEQEWLDKIEEIKARFPWPHETPHRYGIKIRSSE